MTKTQRNQNLAKWRIKNREKIREQHRAWYTRHKNESKLKKQRFLWHKKWAKKNKEYRKEYQRKFRLKNIDRVRENKKRWNRENLEKYRAMRKRELKNPNTKIALYLRNRMRLAVLNQRTMKWGNLQEVLGISIPSLRKYIASKFKWNMSWKNYGHWHIDHIKPLSLFDLSNEKQQRSAFHYTNLQPLWAKENLRKSNKYG